MPRSYRSSPAHHGFRAGSRPSVATPGSPPIRRQEHRKPGPVGGLTSDHVGGRRSNRSVHRRVCPPTVPRRTIWSPTPFPWSATPPLPTERRSLGRTGVAVSRATAVGLSVPATREREVEQRLEGDGDHAAERGGTPQGAVGKDASGPTTEERDDPLRRGGDGQVGTRKARDREGAATQVRGHRACPAWDECQVRPQRRFSLEREPITDANRDRATSMQIWYVRGRARGRAARGAKPPK